MEDILNEDIKKTIKTKDNVIKERKEKVFNFLKQRRVWVCGLLIVALILGIYIRSLPMHIRPDTGKPGLWDITTNDWTLGPDLDPWLFTRYAKTIVEQGGLPEVDIMRNVPLGFETSKETRLLPYMIVVVYNLVNLFGDYSINFSAAIFPVIMFALTIIAFFLFVREIFVRKSDRSKTKADVIALISIFFMIVIPVFLSRTVAGIPEKESAGFFFMFLAFYLFLKAWKTDSLKNGIILGVLAGISTGAMGLVWGGVVYVFVAIAVATLVAFILGIIHKKEFYIYFVWILLSFFILIVFSNQISAGTLISSLDTGLAFLVLFILFVDYILWNTKINKIKLLQQKIPGNILSLIIAVILGIILSSIFFGPGFLIEKLKYLNQILFKPVVGRWNITVAENRQPFFTEWSSSFGPFLKNIPVLFWLFFIGSVVLFKKMLIKIKKKEAWVLTGLYVLFFFGLVFSRYSSSSIFNGESFISKLFYYGSALLLIGTIIYYYSKDHQENKSYKKIRYEYIFLFSLFALCLFTARSAVRLIMVLGPIAPIFLSFLIVEGVEKFRQTKDVMKIIMGVFLIMILLLSLYIFFNDYREVKIYSRGMIPSYYNQQWQKAMSWVRENTNKNAVFSHWWDYGYWLQSIGERATVLDGGNLITYWNYLMGRHVLTGDNQDDALEFLYNHNATHLLIDSSDIGKYGAFSGIGSDENYDRYSFIPDGVVDNNQIQETSEGLVRIYQIGTATDEDIIYESNGSKIFLPGGRTALAGVVVESVEQNGSISLFKQPRIIFFYNNQQITIPLRYLYFNKEFIDFESGIEGTAYIIPRLFADGRIDNVGALIYISPRVMRGYLAQKYLLDDPFNNFPNFKTEYVESSEIVNNLRAYGIDVGEFVYYAGVHGPIKIWGIQYTGKEEIKEEYLDTNPEKYISWEL